MNSFIELVFYTLFFLVIYTYLIYPVVIKTISLFYPEKFYKSSHHTISILISAFNEEKVIEKRIRNIADQNIDFSMVEVLVASDGSTDKTNNLLLELQKEHKWLKVFIFDIQRGKALVLNDLVNNSLNDIIVLTDANTIFDDNSLDQLVKGFADESIGGVSGRLILIDQPESKKKGIDERKYWEYESLIKKSEGRCGILIGANGGIFAIRRELYSGMPPDKAVTDDFFITLSVLSQNRKFIYNYNIIGREEVAPDIKSEFKRKIRFASTNFQTLAIFKKLLFSNNILLSFAFWSHKVIRWFVPLFLILLIPLNILLLHKSNLFNILFIIQMVFYSLALLGFIFTILNVKLKLFSLFSYFILTNVALFLGLFKYLRGKHSAVWESTPR